MKKDDFPVNRFCLETILRFIAWILILHCTYNDSLRCGLCLGVLLMVDLLLFAINRCANSDCIYFSKKSG